MVKPGTQPGTTMLLRGKGIKHVQQQRMRGNHYVNLNVKIPTKLDEKQTQLIEEFDEIERAKTNTPAGQKMSYSVHNAWSRLKSFVKETATDAANAAAAAAETASEKKRKEDAKS